MKIIINKWLPNRKLFLDRLMIEDIILYLYKY